MQIDFAKYIDAGYRIFPVKGKFPHFPSLPFDKDNKPTWLPFTERFPTDSEIESWEKKKGFTGVAILLGKDSGIIGLDYDCFNDYPDILRLIPESPVIRVGKSPKWMRIYKYNSKLPSQKIKLRKVGEVQDGIELLTDGRYFVAEGIHPDTQKPYFYVGEHILNVNKEMLPEFPLANWQKICAIAESYLDNGYKEINHANEPAGRHDKLLQLCGKLLSANISDAEIVDALNKADDSFAESYFETHKNTPEKMLASVKKTHKRNESKKNVATVVEEKQLNVVVDTEGIKPPNSKAIMQLIEMGVPINKHGNPVCNDYSINLILEKWNGISRDFIWYDEFHRCFFTKGLIGDGPLEQWDNKTHLHNLLIRIQSGLGFTNLKKEITKDCVIAYALKNKKNEVKEYIHSLKWDGVKRIDNFLSKCFGADETEYISTASKNLWLGIVARAMNPGCKLDTMIVLEGQQGKYKSTALRKMVGDAWFGECHQSPDNKDFYMTLQGKLLIEIAELESFSKAENTSIKRMLSCQVDRFRAPYGEIAKDWPRQGLFVGTTNEKGYLKDSTGNRRFWPVQTRTINIEEIEKNRDQYFAESYARFCAGEDWYKMPEKETIDAQESRLQEDSWQETINQYLVGRGNTYLKEVALEALKFDLKDVNKAIENRIGSCLRRAGFEYGFIWEPISRRNIRTWRRIDEK